MLVVGGMGAGKRRYVLERGYREEDIADAVLDDRPVLAGLQRLLREYDGPPEDLLARLDRKEVVICDEIGCGVVPADAADRAWRDRVGRTCALLAARADRVVRLCCGLPRDLKGGDACG